MHKAKGHFLRSLVTNLFAYNVLLQPRTSAPLERKNHLPILFHVDHGPLVSGSGRQSDVETAEIRLPVVGIFAFGIGVVNDRAEAYAAADRRPPQHIEIAVGIAERSDRPAADGLIDCNRLACLVVDEIDFIACSSSWLSGTR